MYLTNSSRLVLFENGSFNESDYSESESLDTKTRIAIIAIPILVAASFIIGYVATILCKVTQWRKEPSCPENGRVKSSERENISDLNLGQSAANLDKKVISEKNAYLQQDEVFEYAKEDFNKSVPITKRRYSTTDDSNDSTSTPSNRGTSKYSYPKRRCNQMRTNHRISMKHRGYGLTVKKSFVRSRIVEGPLMMGRNKGRNSDDISTTPYPSSLSTFKSIGRKPLTSRNVPPVKNVVGQTACLDSQCDCRLCRRYSKSSSMLPNRGSLVPATTSGEERKGSVCSSCADYRSDYNRTSNKIHSHRNVFPSIDDDDEEEDNINEMEVDDMVRMSSSEVRHHPSTIKSAPTLLGTDIFSSPSLHLDDLVPANDVRAFSNTNCFPSAWDYEPGGFRDYEVYKNRLRNLQRIQHYRVRPYFHQNYYNQRLIGHSRIDTRKIPETRPRVRELVYFKYENQMWAAVKDGNSSNCRVIPIGWLRDEDCSENNCSCSYCDSRYSSCSSNDSYVEYADQRRYSNQFSTRRPCHLYSFSEDWNRRDNRLKRSSHVHPHFKGDVTLNRCPPKRSYQDDFQRKFIRRNPDGQDVQTNIQSDLGPFVTG